MAKKKDKKKKKAQAAKPVSSAQPSKPSKKQHELRELFLNARKRGASLSKEKLVALGDYIWEWV